MFYQFRFTYAILERRNIQCIYSIIIYKLPSGLLDVNDLNQEKATETEYGLLMPLFRNN